MSNIDLNELAKSHHLELTITASQEENPNDAQIRRFKEIALFLLSILLVICVFVFCVYILLSTHASAVDQKWATTLIGAVISGLLGYLTGRRTS